MERLEDLENKGFQRRMRVDEGWKIGEGADKTATGGNTEGGKSVKGGGWMLREGEVLFMVFS